MIALRYVLIFILPMALAVVLHYVTLQFRLEHQEAATSLMNDMLSDDQNKVAQAVDSLLQGNFTRSLILLKYLSLGSVVVGSAVFALLIPKGASINRTFNLITTMIVGFCFARVFDGYLRVEWMDFAVCLAIGSGCSLVIARLRGALV